MLAVMEIKDDEADDNNNDLELFQKKFECNKTLDGVRQIQLLIVLKYFSRRHVSCISTDFSCRKVRSS